MTLGPKVTTSSSSSTRFPGIDALIGLRRRVSTGLPLEEEVDEIVNFQIGEPLGRYFNSALIIDGVFWWDGGPPTQFDWDQRRGSRRPLCREVDASRVATSGTAAIGASAGARRAMLFSSSGPASRFTHQEPLDVTTQARRRHAIHRVWSGLDHRWNAALPRQRQSGTMVRSEAFGLLLLMAGVVAVLIGMVTHVVQVNRADQRRP